MESETQVEIDAAFIDAVEASLGDLVPKDLYALARRGAEMQWRPIETAPKDVVWATDGGTCFTAIPVDNEWFTGWTFSDHSQTRIRVYPTHWMPLPPPPKGEQE